MVFLPGLKCSFRYLFNFVRVLQRCPVESVFADPEMLMPRLGRYPMGQNPSIYDAESFQKFAAPLRLPRDLGSTP